MTEASQARAAAIPMEAKKNSLRQTQDGLWKVEFTVKAEDMPQTILNAAMGTRYMLAAVEIGDNEEAVPQEPTAGEKAKRHFEALCQDEEFERWLWQKEVWRVPDVDMEQSTRWLAKLVMNIQSANELLDNPEPWDTLYNEFKYRDHAR